MAAAGPMSKSKIITHIADEAEVSKKTAAKMLDWQDNIIDPPEHMYGF